MGVNPSPLTTQSFGVLFSPGPVKLPFKISGPHRMQKKTFKNKNADLNHGAEAEVVQGWLIE